MIVTIDGPAGAGKSSAARRLASELGFEFLDTGAMYRAVTWAALNQGIDLQDFESVFQLAQRIKIELVNNRVVVDGQDVSQEIREPVVTAQIFAVADNPKVRHLLVDQQRSIASRGRFVCEGRDQGTVAFPQAECKIFLTASPQSRAQRRVAELSDTGQSSQYQEILDQQNERDQRDSSRSVGKLLKAADAIEFHTDDLTLDQVVAQLKQIVLQRIGQKHRDLRTTD
jgi:cytidylate kinase